MIKEFIKDENVESRQLGKKYKIWKIWEKEKKLKIYQDRGRKIDKPLNKKDNEI